MNGPVENAGRVEICFGNRFGTVCDRRSWGRRNAAVVCSQLGFGSRGKYVKLDAQSINIL